MKIIFTIESKNVGIFFELLSSGIMIEIQSGWSIRHFLCNQLGIDPAYIEKQVQTIFLNGRAIDDIDGAVVSDGSVLALSAAMPGLAGAIFRKGGKLSSMRSDVTSASINQEKPLQQGTVVLKLFNQVAADQGKLFLKNGICVSGSVFQGFAESHRGRLKKISLSIEIDGEKYLPEEGFLNPFDSKKICLSIKMLQ